MKRAYNKSTQITKNEFDFPWKLSDTSIASSLQEYTIRFWTWLEWFYNDQVVRQAQKLGLLFKK